jgi:hypothetical protein
MSRRLERGTDLWQSLSDIRGAIHVLYPKNIDKLSQWQSHNLGPQVSERDQLGVAWFIDTEINNTSAINFLGASNTNGRVRCPKPDLIHPYPRPCRARVVGHAEDGSLIIKPVLHHELQFHQSLQQDHTLAALLPFALSSQRLEGTIDPPKPDSTEGIIVHPVADSKDVWCFLFFLILVCERLTIVFGVYRAWC